MSSDNGLTLAERLAAKERTRRGAAEAAFRQLVIGTADGADLDDDTAAEVLAAAGRTPADLQRDAVRLTARRDFWRLVTGRADAERRQSELTAERQRAEAERAAVLAGHDQRIAEVAARQTIAGRDLAATQLAERELRVSADDDLRRAAEWADRDLAVLRTAIDRARHRIRAAEAALADPIRDETQEVLNIWATAMHREPTPRALAAQKLAARAEAELPTLRDELARYAAVLPEAEQRAAEAADALLIP